MKRAGGGKAKGGGFERKVCKALSLWITAGAREDVFWRSAMSGGRATVMIKRGAKNQTGLGDVTAVDPLGNPLTDKFLIECKTYRNLHLHLLLSETTDINQDRRKDRSILDFWWRCLRESASSGRLPFLVAKQNNMQPFVCLCGGGVAHFNLDKNTIAHYRLHGVYLFWLSDFLQRASVVSVPVVRVRRQLIRTD